MEESRRLYERSVALDPNIFQTLFGWAQMEETDRNFSRAGELLDAAEKLAPGAPSVKLQRAVLLAASGLRQGARGARRDRSGAPAAAASGRSNGRRRGNCSTGWAAMPKLSPRSPRESAFCAKSPARPISRTRPRTLARAAEGVLHRRAALASFPRAGVRKDVAQPIFIVGFPRSGTTMIEQTLSAHPEIAAGDELPTSTR